MNFAAPVYLIFLAVVFVVYWQLGRRKQNLFLLAASYFFYANWDWRFLGLIIASTAVDYLAGSRIFTAATPRDKKAWLVVSLAVNLGILGYFKYFNFFAESFVELATGVGFPVSWSTAHIILPVGISFYTFQTMSYTIDIYRGKLEPTKSLIDFATFVAFFPQLVAGPIVRATEFVFQLEKPRAFRASDLEYGLSRFVGGFFKKAFIADTLATYLVDPVFKDPSAYSSGTLWLALIGFTVQIYADFSGYSSMAIGSARILGLRLPENFSLPYLSVNIAEFWRRWHISMSTWFRDYVYFALGGSRRGEVRSTANLALTVLVSGLWHGAAWTFVLFGLAHGVFIFINQMWRRIKQARGWVASRPAFYMLLLAWLVTHLANSVGLILFRSVDVASAGHFLGGLFASTGTSTIAITMLMWIALIATPLEHLVGLALERRPQLLMRIPVTVRSAAYVAAVIFLLHARPEQVSPFIYFQF